jgi:hypothetical protein
MPSARTQDTIIREAEGLLDATERSPDIQPEVEKERKVLSDSLVEVKSVKARQQELTAQRQDVTQQLTAALARLRDAVLVFRSVVKGKIGPRSERLVHFKVAPLRKRSRKRGILEKPPPDGEVAGTKPGASASPSAKPVD